MALLALCSRAGLASAGNLADLDHVVLFMQGIPSPSDAAPRCCCCCC